METDFIINPVWREWTDSNLSPGEASAMAELAIYLNGNCLTKNRNRIGQIQESVLVSVLPFAWWLCGNYWRICHEPGLPPCVHVAELVLENWRMAHCMLSIGDGYAWPDLTFFADGPSERIKSARQSEAEAAGQPLSYLRDLDGMCPRAEFVNAILGLLEATAERAGSLEPDFASDWQQLASELRNEATANYRILEALLGRDAGYAPEALMNDFIAASSKVGWESLCEIASGLNPVYGGSFESQRQGLMRSLEASACGIAATVNVPRPELARGFPWQQGRELAQKVRKLLGLGLDQPVTKKLLLNCLGLTARRFAAIKTAGRLSLSKVNGQKVSLVFPDHGTGRYLTSRLFQLARALGGMLSLPSEEQALVMSASQRAQQQIQRNFATEFLAPLESVKAMLPDRREPLKKDIEAIASHFQTSPQTIAHSLVNQGELAPLQAERLLA